ncbi:hypothetical protein [Leifsonia virtsii]|uniref:Uncharacterized protein n=1 Tax=Leifsonia virtsii TaxID=3035915 RepID=A0ABT8IV79_9MICO|nr:hypothetical protein [Leifsonia virtsii]MDN4596700.1 hypothetical protein [Leifsonia virtsii]
MTSLMWQMYQGLNRDVLPKEDLQLAFRFPRAKPTSAYIYVSPTSSGACIGVPDREPDLTVIVEPLVLNDLGWGKRACAAAIATGDVGFEGSPELARAYPTWFRPRSLSA